MWALITEAALGYSLSIPDWVLDLIGLAFLCCLLLFVIRFFRAFFDKD